MAEPDVRNSEEASSRRPSCLACRFSHYNSHYIYRFGQLCLYVCLEIWFLWYCVYFCDIAMGGEPVSYRIILVDYLIHKHRSLGINKLSGDNIV